MTTIEALEPKLQTQTIEANDPFAETAGVSRIRVRSLGDTATLFAFNGDAAEALGKGGPYRLRNFFLRFPKFMHVLEESQHHVDLLSDGLQVSVRPPLNPDQLKAFTDACFSGEFSEKWHPGNPDRKLEIIDNNDWSPQTPSDNGSCVSDYRGKVIANSLNWPVDTAVAS